MISTMVVVSCARAVQIGSSGTVFQVVQPSETKDKKTQIGMHPDGLSYTSMPTDRVSHVQATTQARTEQLEEFEQSQTFQEALRDCDEFAAALVTGFPSILSTTLKAITPKFQETPVSLLAVAFRKRCMPVVDLLLELGVPVDSHTVKYLASWRDVESLKKLAPLMLPSRDLAQALHEGALILADSGFYRFFIRPGADPQQATHALNQMRLL